MTTDATASGPTDERPPETGWLPDTPVDDNLLRQFLHNQADVCDVIAAQLGGVVARTEDVALAASRCVIPYFNEALLLRPLRRADDVVLDEIERFFTASAAPSCVILSAWPTPSLMARGWQLVGHPAFVVRTPGVPLRPPASRPGVSLDVRPATAPDDVAAAERVFVEGYPVPEGEGRTGDALPAGIGTTEVTVRIAAVDGPDVAVGMGHVAHGCVNLCGAATLPGARRTGAWGALVRARVADAEHLPAVAFTSDFSRPGFEHLGFVSILRFTLWAR